MNTNHRYEQAVKDGIDIPENGYWGDIPSRICGEYGGAEDNSIYNDTTKPPKINIQSKQLK